jgi:chaperone LolA
MFCSCVTAQSGTGIIKKIQERFNSISSFSASFSQSVSGVKVHSAYNYGGKFYYKKKNKFCAEMKNRTIVSDGESVWNYDARLKRVVVSNGTADPAAFSLERFIYEYPGDCTVKEIGKGEEGKDGVEIELIPKSRELEFKSARIYTGSDWMINSLEVVDSDGTNYSFKLSDIDYKSNIPDSKFRYSPPQGIKVIDLR